MRASGDPGKLVGQREPAASDMRRFGDPSVIGEPVVLTFSVRNPSARSARELASKIALPPEVTQADILDPDGLQAGHDSESPYLYSAKVDLAPGETKTFNVSVRNCWQIDAAATQRLAADVDRALRSIDSIHRPGRCATRTEPHPACCETDRRAVGDNSRRRRPVHIVQGAASGVATTGNGVPACRSLSFHARSRVTIRLKCCGASLRRTSFDKGLLDVAVCDT